VSVLEKNGETISLSGESCIFSYRKGQFFQDENFRIDADSIEIEVIIGYN
jgi:hypothetical protein